MTTNYDLSKIRTLLIDGFSETELRDFCFDTPEFRPVHYELADLTGKAAIVRHLLEFAERRELFDPLLAWVKVNNPAKYARYQPYQSSADKLTLTHPIHLELVRIPAGEFLMGSDPAKDKNAREDEQPQHRVYVSEFYIGRYPVTNEQYAVFVREAKHRAFGHLKEGKIPVGKENHPVIWVSWDDAVAFGQWLSQASNYTCRLPTEAEWEKAARGTNGRFYPRGNQWDKSKLNSEEGGLGDTTPVGRYSPGGDSAYGAVDMAGNVWEWCSDSYDVKEYQGRGGTVIKDPAGAKQGAGRVLRGGSWRISVKYARCASRWWDFSYGRYDYLGFRVVVSSIHLNR